MEDKTDECKNEVFINDLGSMNSDKINEMSPKNSSLKQYLIIGGIIALIIIVLIILIILLTKSPYKDESSDKKDEEEIQKDKIGEINCIFNIEQINIKTQIL